MLGPQCTKVIATKWLEIAPIQHLVLQEVGASTAKDLPHWVFMLILVLLFGGGGLVYSMSSCSEFLVQSISRQIMSNIWMLYAWRYAKYNKMKMREGEKTPGLVEFMNYMYGRTMEIFATIIQLDGLQSCSDACMYTSFSWMDFVTNMDCLVNSKHVDQWGLMVSCPVQRFSCILAPVIYLHESPSYVMFVQHFIAFSSCMLHAVIVWGEDIGMDRSEGGQGARWDSVVSTSNSFCECCSSAEFSVHLTCSFCPNCFVSLQVSSKL